MGRLIDADELTKILMEEIPLAENVHIFKDMIENQPTAYDVDKVVKSLEELILRYDSTDFAIKGIICKIIEIVKDGEK